MQQLIRAINYIGGKFFLLPALLLFVIVSACAPQAQISSLERNVSGLQVETQRLNREVSTLKKQLAPGSGQGSLRKSYARLNSRIDILESELMRINGLIEQANYKQEQQEQELARLRAALLGQGTPVHAGNATATRKNPPATSSVVAPVVTKPQKTPSQNIEEKKSEPDLYQQGLELFRQGKYQAAKELFRTFIRENPDSKMVSNAHFWIGDCEYKLSRFEEAILEYQKVISKFPKSNKVPDALLKQGFAFARLGDRESAKIVLKKLIKQYPSTPQAKAAKKQLKRLG